MTLAIWVPTVDGFITLAVRAHWEMGKLMLL